MTNLDEPTKEALAPSNTSIYEPQKTLPKNFKYVRLPRAVFEADLGSSEKIILAEVAALDKGNGCHAGNKHFARLLGIRPDSVSRILRDLASRDFLKYEFKRDGGKGNERLLKIGGGLGINAERGSAPMPNGLGANAERGSAFMPKQESNSLEGTKDFFVESSFEKTQTVFLKNELPHGSPSSPQFRAAPLTFTEAYGSCLEIAAFDVAQIESGIDPMPFVRRAANWSARRDTRSHNWPAEIQNFIFSDRRDGKHTRPAPEGYSPLFVAVAAAAAAVNAGAGSVPDFMRRVDFLATYYRVAVAAKMPLRAGSDPERAAELFEALREDRERAATFYFQRNTPST